jgi:very-short-patch-repair endonuclease
MLALCCRHSLSQPAVNTTVDGYEVDFAWPDARLIVETDGPPSRPIACVTPS